MYDMLFRGLFGAAKHSNVENEENRLFRDPLLSSLFLRSLSILFFLLGLPAKAFEFNSPQMVAVYSFFAPGSGQMANGDSEEGSYYLFSNIALNVGAQHFYNKEDYIEKSYHEAENYDTLNHSTLSYRALSSLRFNAALYSSYAAYRDAYKRSGSTMLNHDVPAPRNDLADLAYAPFNSEVLRKSEVWLPMVLMGALSFRQPQAGEYYVDGGGMSRNFYTTTGIASTAFAPAVGEEAFFRGVLNTELSSKWGPTWGLLASSTFFGLAHSGKSNTANKIQAFSGGLYLGWVHQHNNYDLKASTAIHFWNNLLAVLAAARNGKNFGKTQVSMQWNMPY